MVDNRQYHQLEAYLDHQLPANEAAAFEAAVANDSALAQALNERRAFRRATREALGEADDLDLDRLAKDVARAARTNNSPSSRPRAWRRVRWPLLAAAALTVAVLAPRLLRNTSGVPDQHPTITHSGRVVALRFGEQTETAVHLEAGCYHRSLGECP